jgi:hypothetical protein
MNTRKPKSKKGNELKEPIKLALNPYTIANCPGIMDLCDVTPKAISDAINKANREANLKEAVRSVDEAIKKLELLFPHYGLSRTGNDAGDFKLLCLKMAHDLFPGFRVVAPNQKPFEHSRSNSFTLTQLLADVEDVKLARSCKDAPALRELTQKHPVWSAYPWQTLKNWLLEAKDEKCNPFFRLWRLAEANGQLLSLIKIFRSKPVASRK